MSELLKINVNDHVEKKGQLSYLSWAWAWAEVLKLDPGATWVAHEFGPDGCQIPMMVLPDQTAMVKVGVTLNGAYKQCLLPVMDNRNKAIIGPDAMDVNKAIMRCLAKAIAMHGLGLYIYSGEDLPESEPVAKAPIIPASPKIELTPEDEQFLSGMAIDIRGMCADGSAVEALQMIRASALDSDQQIALNNMLDSKVRSALKKAKEFLTTKETA